MFSKHKPGAPSHAYRKPALWGTVVAVGVCLVVVFSFLTQQKKTSPAGSSPLPEAEMIAEPMKENTPPMKEYTGYPAYDTLIHEVTLARQTQSEDVSSSFSYVLAAHNDYETPGWLVQDLDGNGVEELIFGANTDGVIYNIYTLSDGAAVQILNGWNRSRYYLCEDGSIANQWSSGAFYWGHAYYTYAGTELTLKEAVLYLENTETAETPWFYSTQNAEFTEDAEPISEKKAKAIQAHYSNEYPQYTLFKG